MYSGADSVEGYPAVGFRVLLSLSMRIS